MNKFSNIDTNRIASAKQVYAVASHFANIHASVPSERFGLTKCFNAIINKFYNDQDAHLTHGDIQEFFEFQVVPDYFVSLLRTKAKPKARPKAKPKAAKKVKCKAQPKVDEYVAKVEPKAKPVKKVAENSVAKKLNGRMEAIEGRFDSLESKVGDIEAGLAMILEAVQAK
tara:strand:- start:3900 stop:4409 length:510 start_codon:yes stop_codon:yes gene_type:complete